MSPNQNPALPLAKPDALDLVLSHHWYDEIESGRKRFEYREIKPYWTKRLFMREYDSVRFRRGYSSICMTFRLEGIEEFEGTNDLGLGRCYRLALGERIDR